MTDTLEDSFNPGTDNTEGFVGAMFYKAQTFTASSDYKTTSASVKLWNDNGVVAPTGNLTYEIRTTSGGIPTSTIIATGTVSSPNRGVSPGTFYNITFSSGVNLTENTQYALVVWSTTLQTNGYDIRGVAAGGYSGGSSWSSTDNGSTWSDYFGSVGDFVFQIYGIPITNQGNMFLVF